MSSNGYKRINKHKNFLSSPERPISFAIRKGIDEKIKRKTSLKETRKRRIAREKAYASFEIQTNPNPYIYPDRNFIENNVLGVWHE